PQIAAARRAKLHLDARGAGVYAVLHQLLDDGGGTLHDLASRDLVGDPVGKNAYPCHGGPQASALRQRASCLRICFGPGIPTPSRADIARRRSNTTRQSSPSFGWSARACSSGTSGSATPS